MALLELSLYQHGYIGNRALINLIEIKESGSTVPPIAFQFLRSDSASFQNHAITRKGQRKAN